MRKKTDMVMEAMMLSGDQMLVVVEEERRLGSLVPPNMERPRAWRTI